MNENATKYPLATKITFSGNCPECEMKKIDSEMLVNSMDFFECPECHLQVTAFPDAVAVLRWRGEGEFRKTVTKATDGFIGQQLFASSDKNEILPNKDCSLSDYFDLEEYISYIYPTYENWKHEAASYENFDFSKQEEHLESIDAEFWENLLQLWKEVEKNGIPSESFDQLTEVLYNGGVVFDFPWQNWKEGLKNVQKGVKREVIVTLLEASKYLTVIFRLSRYKSWHLLDLSMLSDLFKFIKNNT